MAIVTTLVWVLRSLWAHPVFAAVASPAEKYRRVKQEPQKPNALDSQAWFYDTQLKTAPTKTDRMEFLT